MNELETRLKIINFITKIVEEKKDTYLEKIIENMGYESTGIEMCLSHIKGEYNLMYEDDNI